MVPDRFGLWLSVLASFLMLATGVGGLAFPSLYARETANWATQGRAQDLADVFLAVPALLAGVAMTMRRQPAGRPLLLGGLLYTAYTYAIYAFGVHFNAFFPAYCATLGTSAYAIVFLALPADAGVPPPGAARGPALTLLAIAVIFGLLWLSEDLPAIVRGVPPPSLAEVGLPANPVHVLDYALVLPAFFVTGWRVLRHRPGASLHAAALLAFGVLMALAIAVMIVMLGWPAGFAGVAPAALMVILAALAGVMFTRQVRALPR